MKKTVTSATYQRKKWTHPVTGERWPKFLLIFLGCWYAWTTKHGVRALCLPLTRHTSYYLAKCLGAGWLAACLLACLMSQQQASVSQGRICSDNFTCCHTEIEVADQALYLTQSQYTDTGPTSPSADPITPGAWQGSHWSANF